MIAAIVGLETYLDLLVLHLVLDRSQKHSFLITFTNLETLGDFNHSFQELIVDGFMDIDSLDGQADLSRVEEGEGGNLAEIS